MDFQGIVRVESVRSDDETNRFLQAGWLLLHVGQYKEEERAGKEYVVGWPADKGEPINPPSRYKTL